MSLTRELAPLATVGMRARERGLATRPPPPAILRMPRPPVEVVDAYLDELIAEALAHPAPVPLPAPVRRTAPVVTVPPPTALQVVSRLLSWVEREIAERERRQQEGNARTPSKARGALAQLRRFRSEILKEKHRCRAQ